MSTGSSRRRGRGLGSSLRSGKVYFPLTEALEEFVALTAAADKDVFVFEHRFDDAKDGFGPEVVSAIKAVHLLEDLVFAEAGVFERALLEPILLDEVGFVFL